MSHPKGVHALIHAALLADQVNDLISVPNRSICEQIDVRSDTIDGFLLREDLLEGLVDLCTAKIGLKCRDLLDSLLKGGVCVGDATLVREHELMSATVAANVEAAAGGDTVEEGDQRLPG